MAQACAAGRCVGFKLVSLWSYGARSDHFPRTDGERCVGALGKGMSAASLQELCSRSSQYQVSRSYIGGP